MCDFFSCISNGQGKIFYFNWELRKQCLSGKLDYDPDSHSSIAHYFKKNEDKHNKYEFNPLTKKFTIDQLNTKDDSESVKQQLLLLDFVKIVPSLRIKEIYNPLLLPHTEVTTEAIDLLHKWHSLRASIWTSVRASIWASVGASVRASIWDSVRASVGDSVRASVWASLRASIWTSVRASIWASVWASVGDSVRASVGDSVGDSVRASVWASVGDSVRASVWASVGDSVGAYAGSFFIIETWKYAENFGSNPWYSNNRLWELGFVPSFDGKTWRLHSGPKAEIVYEWTPEK